RGNQFSSASTSVGADADIAVWGGDHTISLSALLQYQLDPVTSSLSGRLALTYVAPFDLPVRRQRGIGRLEGHAFDAEDGVPLERVVLRVSDQAVVTGQEGTYRFTSLVPGEHFMEVDTSRVGQGLIVDLPVPLRVSIKSDETTTVVLPIVRSSRIEGSIDLYVVPGGAHGLLGTLGLAGEREYEDAELLHAGGIPNSVVHFIRDDELRRVLTDQHGRFTLADIRPGRWRIQVGTNQLPRYHRLVEEEIDVTVEAGEQVTVAFQVFPIHRPVTMLAVSDTLLTIATSTEKPAEEPPAVEDEPPPPVDSVTRAVLSRLAERRYVEPLADSPRLLSLPWGSSPETAALLLVDRISEELEEAEATLVSRTITTVTYSSGGRFLLGLSGSVELTFLDLGEAAPQLFLIGVTLKFTGDENLRAINQMESMYREMLALFSSRWKTGEIVGEVMASVESYRTTIGEIDIRYSFDENAGSITVEYRDDWFVRAEASIIESRQ
ncbi:MAG: carboxypeptidase-like regulatory domain-containing protein, partial [Spirochaetia bacterium]